MVAIDLGQRTTKAVHLQRKGQTLEIADYALVESPAAEQAHTPEVIGDHLKTVVEAIKYKGKKVSLVLGVNDALLRHAELPFVPIGDMRLMLKYNSKNYLQQDLTDYVFDCQTLSFGSGNPAEAIKAGQKARVLVGGARKQTLDHLNAAAKHAGLILDQVVPGLVCTANAFEVAYPEIFTNEVVALVDIGFKSSSISILANGELSLNRVVLIGADKLTAGLAEAMGVSYAEAEGIKVGLPEEVMGAMQGLTTPLGRELRASIDFFEHQQDKAVSQVFVSGGSARSPFIVESLQSELMVQTSSWNPIAPMNMALPAEKLGEAEQIACQLAVAVGGALAAF
ncbi:MAG TPA: pilus assembly protein PilM [Verrucomicrobiae bacterium]